MNTSDYTIDRTPDRTVVRDENGTAVIMLPGDVPDALAFEVVRIRERAFLLGIRTGRAQHAYELRKLLREGEE